MTADMFDDYSAVPDRENIEPGAVLLRRFSVDIGLQLLAAVAEIAKAAPWRRMITPGGFRMSVAMTNCGDLGWVSDRHGYRYAALDPESGRHWPPMPGIFRELATHAAGESGFSGFSPDACLVNRYEPGARMALHQDRDEQDLLAPIVSVSLGLPAVFQLGGERRSDPVRRISLAHGDVVVWGGPARLRFHGVLPLKHGDHPLLGCQRINLTFRKAG